MRFSNWYANAKAAQRSRYTYQSYFDPNQLQRRSERITETIAEVTLFFWCFWIMTRKKKRKNLKKVFICLSCVNPQFLFALLPVKVSTLVG